MHTTTPEAYGMFAAAMMNAVVKKLISKDVLSKHEAHEICVSIKDAFAAKGVRHDSPVETDAALLASTLAAEIDAAF